MLSRLSGVLKPPVADSFAAVLATLAVAAASAATPSPARAAGPAVGTPAPAFELPDQNGKSVSLADHRGQWVVLYFYPKDNTPGCTTQACEFRDNIFAFRDAEATILGISVDDVASHSKFAEEHSLPFPILADAEKTVAKRYGVLYKAMGTMELARRETFLIDPQGRIAKHYTAVNPKGHSQLVLADIKALSAKAKTAATAG